MRKALLFVIVCSFGVANGQVLRSDHVIDRNSGGFLEFHAAPENKGVESVFIDEDWATGEIYLKSGNSIQDVPLRYDLKNNRLEVKAGSEIKIAQLSIIDSFKVVGLPIRKFVNARCIPELALSGVVEELVAGKVSLYSVPEFEIIPASYNAALDVGNKKDQFAKKERLVLLQNNKAIEVPRGRKKILDQFGSYADEVENFAKKNSLSFKNSRDISKMVIVFNQLVSAG